MKQLFSQKEAAAHLEVSLRTLKHSFKWVGEPPWAYVRSRADGKSCAHSRAHRETREEPTTKSFRAVLAPRNR